MGCTRSFSAGPVFCNLLLADEINRASPRTQSALLEAMQEGTVTAAGTTYPLPRPFCVLATQNPVELHGTYPLPEAQLDRFMLKLRFGYPSGDELEEIVVQTNERVAAKIDASRAPSSCSRWAFWLARCRPRRWCSSTSVDLVLALQPAPDGAAMVRDYVRLGPSPRAAQALSLAGRITALLEGRHNLSVEDVRSVAMPALRHRLVLNFDAEREAVAAETIVADVLAAVRELIARAADRSIRGGGEQRGPLLDRATSQALEALSLESLDALVAGLVGEREGPGQAAGFEFADYRRYIPGDDVRRIDWNIYARLRELHIRTSPQEASLCAVGAARRESLDGFGRAEQAALMADAWLRCWALWRCCATMPWRCTRSATAPASPAAASTPAAMSSARWSRSWNDCRAGARRTWT